MAVVGHSAGPARRPGEVLYPSLIPAHVLQSVPVLTPFSLVENRTLVAIPIVNDYHMAHGAHFLIETRPIINIRIRNERYGGPLRYPGRRAIFPTQILLAAGICIFPTRTFGVLVLRTEIKNELMGETLHLTEPRGREGEAAQLAKIARLGRIRRRLGSAGWTLRSGRSHSVCGTAPLETV